MVCLSMNFFFETEKLVNCRNLHSIILKRHLESLKNAMHFQKTVVDLTSFKKCVAIMEIIECASLKTTEHLDNHKIML